MSEQRIVAIIQARMSSSRLPGKVLADLFGKPMLGWVVNRTGQAKTIQDVVVATTIHQEDDAIAHFCQQNQIPIYRGSHFDVLDRYFRTAQHYFADIVVRITADCPLIDPQLIDLTVQSLFDRLPNGDGQFHCQPRWDFAANRLPPPFHRTYPIGLDTEVCTYFALENAWQHADKPHYREHVMPYLYDPERSVHFSTLQSIPVELKIPEGYFKILQVDHDPDYGSLRWTVDTQEDLLLMRHILELLDGRVDFTWLDVLKLFQKDPSLAEINAAVLHKTVQDIDSRCK